MLYVPIKQQIKTFQCKIAYILIKLQKYNIIESAIFFSEECENV